MDGDEPLSRQVPKYAPNNLETFPPARVLYFVMRYAICRMTNLRKINESGNRLPEEMKILDERLKGVKNENVE